MNNEHSISNEIIIILHPIVQIVNMEKFFSIFSDHGNYNHWKLYVSNSMI